MARIVFMGTPDFAVPGAQILLESGHEIVAAVTVPDKQAGRGRKIQESAVKVWAKSHDLPIFQPADLRDKKFIEDLRKCNADLFIVVAFRILPPEVFTLPARGTINLHGSLLPAYRGAAPINWAIINGENETGVTTFLIDEKMDTGAILQQKSVTIGSEETFGELYERLKIVGAELLNNTVQGYLQGEIIPAEQQGQSSRAPKILPDHCEIDWQKSANEIRNLVRGLAPRPTAFSWFKSKRIKIFRCAAIPGESGATPGEVIIADAKAGNLSIATGCGFLQLQEVQGEGKKRMPVADFLRGNHIIAGEMFGYRQN